jgi:dephospho-CoA kinase
MPEKRVVGLIGGIGSGKSLVAEELAHHGGYVISGDQLGHEALRQVDIRTRVVERWGRGILDADGNVNRRRLGEKVFADREERKALEALSFPYIERRIREEIGAARRNPNVAFIVLDAAVMLEAGWNKYCDVLVYVDTPRPLRLERLTARGLSEKEVTARESAQWPESDKAKHARIVVNNSGPCEQLARQIQELVKNLAAVGTTTARENAIIVN